MAPEQEGHGHDCARIYGFKRFWSTRYRDGNHRDNATNGTIIDSTQRKNLLIIKLNWNIISLKSLCTCMLSNVQTFIIVCKSLIEYGMTGNLWMPFQVNSGPRFFQIEHTKNQRLTLEWFPSTKNSASVLPTPALIGGALNSS